MSLIEECCKEVLNHDDTFTLETSGEHSPSPDSSSTDGIYGEPSILPRIGDQYQVEIPPLISETEHLQLQTTPMGSVDDIVSNFYTGKELAIPIIWVHCVANHVGHVQELLGVRVGSDAVQSHVATDSRLDFTCSSVSGISLDSLNNHPTMPLVAKCKLGISNDQLEHDKHFFCLTNQKCGTSDNLMNIGIPSLQSRKIGAWIPLPGSAKAPWSDSESQSFLLGLYIFGKNLVQVQRFVESKDMGDVLSFYYGKFYRSDAQCRWVECRKTRSRKSILGHRIFTGWRQQELLSRLLPNRPKEVQDTLLEMSRDAYAVRYYPGWIFDASVCLHTTIPKYRPSCQTFEVTKGFNEGTASLEEFMFTLKALVGNDALVEAVGIGKGKQDLTGIALDHVRASQAIPSRSEIPAGKACSSLTPEEIIKFLTGDFRLSKAKSNDIFWEAVWPRLLARGWHSEQPKDISVISSKNALVFLIPGIKKFSRKKLTKGNHYFDSVSDVLNKVASDPSLLEFELEEGKESGVIETAEAKVVPNGVSDYPRPCYLRPRLPDFNSDLMKFTVVDTSLAHGGKPSEVRELRSLPADATCSFRPNHPRETNSDNSSEQSSSGDASLNNQGESDQSLQDDKKATDPKSSLPGNGHDLEGNGCEMTANKPSVKCTKFQFSRRVKPNCAAPISKRPRLTSCRSVGAGSRSFRLKEEVPCQPQPVEIQKEAAVDERIPMEELTEDMTPHENPQPRTLIDLNLHPIDFESEGNQDDLKPKESLEADVVLADEPTGNGRRHSTRNRPPTTKALEALACGYLSVGKERSTRASRSSSFTSRSSRRVRKNIEGSLPASATIDPSFGTDEEYSGSTNHMSLYDDSHVRSDRKETHELLGVL